MPDVKISPANIVIGLGVILVLGAFGWLTFGPKAAPPPPPRLTEEARQYVNAGKLKLANVHMQASESYVQSRLVEILGDITNAGERPVKLAEVTCVFRDYSGQPVARERAYVLSGRAGALAPGQTKSFRLAFDTIPESWNQALPSLVIAQIQFE
ncbi:MAG TPA: FxLYD domain-containing protein [Bryobacteraceae bacterium]|nr:FxLYD domain-containing protein [Bryobacteraceae bacterium]